jgi:hypothetical protein
MDGWETGKESSDRKRQDDQHSYLILNKIKQKGVRYQWTPFCFIQMAYGADAPGFIQALYKL